MFRRPHRGEHGAAIDLHGQAKEVAGVLLKHIGVAADKRLAQSCIAQTA